MKENMNSKDIKIEIAEKLARMDIDPVLFIDLFVEQYLTQILNEAGVRTGLQSIWDSIIPSRNRAALVAKQYDLNGKFIEAMNFLKSLEKIISNAPNNSDWSNTTNVQNIFNKLLISINDLEKNANIIKNVNVQIQRAKIGAKITGAKNIDFKVEVLDRKMSNAMNKIKTLDELKTYLDNIDPEVKQKLLIKGGSVNINLPKYTDANNAITELKNNYLGYFNNFDKAILKFANNDRNLADNLLTYFIQKTSIPSFLSGGDIENTLVEKIKGLKSLQDVSNLLDGLNDTEKTQLNQFVSKIDETQDPMKSGLDYYKTSLSGTKYNNLLQSLIAKIHAKFGITDTKKQEKLLVYLLYSSPIFETIKSGKSDAYGGSDPMKNIKSFDE